LGGDRDDLTRFGITALTRTTVATAKAAKASQLDFVTRLEGLNDTLEKEVNHLKGLLFGELGLQGNLSHQVGFGHEFRSPVGWG
jgi:hypothetical protein